MAKLYLRDIGSHPERDLEVTLFPDGELQFEADNGKYIHINITRAGVNELLNFLLEEIRPTHKSSMCSMCGESIVFKNGLCEECYLLSKASSC